MFLNELTILNSGLNRARYMSDTSARDERTLRWGLDEYVWGDPAGCDAPGTHSRQYAGRGSGPSSLGINHQHPEQRMGCGSRYGSRERWGHSCALSTAGGGKWPVGAPGER